MGKKIEFPKNYAIYTNKALKSLQSNNYEEAISYLKKAYTIKDDESINVLLVSALFQNDRIREALEMAEEKKAFYENNERRLLVYVELLLANNNFLKAQKYIDENSKGADSPYYETWLKLDQELYLKRKETERQQREKEEVSLKQLFSLASVSHEEQFNIISQADRLSTQQLQKVSPSVFNNPYVHPLAKSSLLSLLIERKDTKEYSYTWFGESKVIVPSHILPFDKQETVLSLHEIAHHLYEQNPSLFELVSSELKFILLMLFPFIEEVITKGNEKEWIMAIGERAEGIDPNDYQETQSDKETINHWINKIHEEM